MLMPLVLPGQRYDRGLCLAAENNANLTLKFQISDSMSKKFVIRINNLQEKEPEENYDKFVITTIHWHRVIGAGIALLLILALLGWFIFSMVSKPAEESPLSGSNPPDIDEPALFKPAGSPQVFEDEQGGQTEQNTEGQIDTTENTAFVEAEPDIHPDTAAVASAEQFVSEEIMSVVTEEIPDRVAAGVVVDSTEEVVEVQQSIESIASEQGFETEGADSAEMPSDQLQSVDQDNLVGMVVEVDTPPSENRQSSLVEEQVSDQAVIPDQRLSRALEKYRLNSSGSKNNVTVHASGITQARLTSWVERDQPLDHLGSTIYMENDELLRVFLFTEMSGLAGRTLYHHWYLDEKQMAEVIITVRNNEVTASSSKFIDRFMRGSWKVRVTDDLGNLLITANFDVVSG